MPSCAVDHRRIVEDEILLARRRAVAVDDFERRAGERLAPVRCGLAMVAEQQMNCGFDP